MLQIHVIRELVLVVCVITLATVIVVLVWIVPPKDKG